MSRSFSSGFSRDREQGAGRVARRRRIFFHRGLESLEGRQLLSTAGLSDPGAPTPGPALADLGTQFVEEGNSLALQARATDPNGRSLTYSLDQGAPAGATIAPTSGLFLWTPPNAQQTYSIAIRATENGAPGLSDAKTLTVMVFDVAPNVQAGVNATIDQGTAFVRTGSFSDPNPDTWSASVDYGDGSGAQPLALNPDKTFALNHTYTTAGNYTVAVTINDSQGGQGRGFFAVQVNATSTPTQSQPPAGTSQGQSSSGTVQTPTTNNGTSGGSSITNHSTVLIKKHAAQVKVHFPTHVFRNKKHR
jgi:hypothetical protein